MEGQLSLFDTSPEPPKPEEPETDWCLVYLVTRSGGNSGNLFVLRRDDAMKLCEDECSHGQARGGFWMFQWTSLEHFRRNDAAAKEHQNVYGDLEPFVFIQDIGKQDRDFDRLGIKKPTIREMQGILKELGYELKYKTTKQRLIDEGLLTEKDFEETERLLKEKRRK